MVNKMAVISVLYRGGWQCYSNLLAHSDKFISMTYVYARTILKELIQNLLLDSTRVSEGAQYWGAEDILFRVIKLKNLIVARGSVWKHAPSGKFWVLAHL